MEVTRCLSFRNVSLVSQFNILQQHDTSNDFLKQLSADSINRNKFILSEQLLFFHIKEMLLAEIMQQAGTAVVDKHLGLWTGKHRTILLVEQLPINQTAHLNFM